MAAEFLFLGNPSAPAGLSKPNEPHGVSDQLSRAPAYVLDAVSSVSLRNGSW